LSAVYRDVFGFRAPDCDTAAEREINIRCDPKFG
jgi:hypothetical protein